MLSLMASAALLTACNDGRAPSNAASPVRLILDTDLGPDYDDVGAMAVLHALADSGQVRLLATLSSNKDERVVPCIEVINAYFRRPDIPVGAPKGEGGVSLTTWHQAKWTDSLPARYPHRTACTSDAPDAVAVYRRVLAAQPDSSVVVCSIGFLTNLKNLLLSPGDAVSPLSGRELVSSKVRRLVVMGGTFPRGMEFNIYRDAASARIVAEQWPTEIVFSGSEIGDKIRTGKRLAESPVENSPVKDAYVLCFAEGDPGGRMSWDLTAAWVAVKGYAPYYAVERGTFRVVDDEGRNEWTPDARGRHLRLIEKMPPEEMARLLDEAMMHSPQPE